MSFPQALHWCFTINNPEDYDSLIIGGTKDTLFGRVRIIFKDMLSFIKSKVSQHRKRYVMKLIGSVEELMILSAILLDIVKHIRINYVLND